MLRTRLDIAFAVSSYSRHLSNLIEAYKTIVKGVIHYLKGTISLQLVYKGDLKELIGYTDLD